MHSVNTYNPEVVLAIYWGFQCYFIIYEAYFEALEQNELYSAYQKPLSLIHYMGRKAVLLNY